MLMVSALVALALPWLAVLMGLISFLFIQVPFTFEWLPGITFSWGLRHPGLAGTAALLSAISLIYARRMEKQQLSLFLLFFAGLIGFFGATAPLEVFFFLELMLFPAFYIILKEDPSAAFKYFGFMQVSSVLVLAGLVGQGMLASFILTIGFSIKMGIFPFHSWLPDAHSQAPFPLSALLSGCVVACGAYGILRFSTTPLLVLPLGVISAVYGAFMAASEKDVKRLLAHSTVSQMGYAAIALAVAPEFVVLFLVAHALAKAGLFYAAGEIFSATGLRQIPDMGVASKTLFVSASLSILSMLGFPPLLGFFAEIGIITSSLSSMPALVPFLLVAFFPTILYSERLISIFFKRSERRVEAGLPVITAVLLLLGVFMWMQ